MERLNLKLNCESHNCWIDVGVRFIWILYGEIRNLTQWHTSKKIIKVEVTVNRKGNRTFIDSYIKRSLVVQSSIHCNFFCFRGFAISAGNDSNKFKLALAVFDDFAVEIGKKNEQNERFFETKSSWLRSIPFAFVFTELWENVVVVFRTSGSLPARNSS